MGPPAAGRKARFNTPQTTNRTGIPPPTGSSRGSGSRSTRVTDPDDYDALWEQQKEEERQRERKQKELRHDPHFQEENEDEEEEDGEDDDDEVDEEDLEVLKKPSPKRQNRLSEEDFINDGDHCYRIRIRIRNPVGRYPEVYG
jgi:TATA-binding protein-associated factor Taf7